MSELATPIEKSAPPATAPMPRRFPVLGFMSTLAIITYVDRVCISRAQNSIMADLHLTTRDMSFVFLAFGWGYALMEVPGGWLGDRFGSRNVLARIVGWWSLFTAATGWAWNFGSLLVTRFLFGTGEAGCFPNVTRAIKSWLPPVDHARAQGIVWLSARWGGAFTPLLAAFVLRHVSWRWTFALFGMIGLVWVVAFARWSRGFASDRAVPRESESASRTPWKKLLTSRTVGLLCLQYICLNYSWIFYITWLPRYLTQGRGVSPDLAPYLEIFPLFIGGFGCLLSGMLALPIIRRAGSVRAGRRLMACLGFGGASILLFVSLQIKSPLLAMVVMGLAGFANDFTMPVSWATCMDVGGRHTGTLSGTMNMIGAFAAGLAPVIVDTLLEWNGGNWTQTLCVSAVVYLVGFVCWLFIDPVTPLEPAAESSH
jgi:MFS transporter, ACS family, glucarate transporter